MKALTVKKDQLRRVSVTVDPTLDEKYAGKVLFPEKLERAKEILAKHPVPDNRKERKT